MGDRETAAQGLDDGRALLDGTWLLADDVLASLKGQLTNGVGALYEQLEHEA